MGRSQRRKPLNNSTIHKQFTTNMTVTGEHRWRNQKMLSMRAKV